jgi:WD40 repeat protein
MLCFCYCSLFLFLFFFFLPLIFPFLASIHPSLSSSLLLISCSSLFPSLLLSSFISLTLLHSHTLLTSGFEKQIQIFDSCHPPSSLFTIFTWGDPHTPKRKRNKETQKGIISCFSFSPLSHESLFAAGSFDCSIGIYDISSPSSSSSPELFLQGGRRGRRGGRSTGML